MEEFDQQLIPGNIEYFQEYQIRHYLYFVRLEVTEFLLKNIDASYFDFTQLFEKLGIKSSESEIREQIENQIIKELKSLGWCIAFIFGNTSIVIMSSEDKLDNCLWAISFDFKKL